MSWSRSTRSRRCPGSPWAASTTWSPTSSRHAATFQRQPPSTTASPLLGSGSDTRLRRRTSRTRRWPPTAPRRASFRARTLRGSASGWSTCAPTTCRSRCTTSNRRTPSRRTSRPSSTSWACCTTRAASTPRLQTTSRASQSTRETTTTPRGSLPSSTSATPAARCAVSTRPSNGTGSRSPSPRAMRRRTPRSASRTTCEGTRTEPSSCTTSRSRSSPTTPSPARCSRRRSRTCCRRPPTRSRCLRCRRPAAPPPAPSAWGGARA
mmetsp:Transcript_44543/g.144647  ORF Transcript_44543/g.144647 Transcript_44543/m.144647 type:complete len:265 (-) Transcript_44543:261-1055(-)